MHVEPPSHAPTNLKELGIHYVMIVLGILTALGLEAGFEALHHRRLASHTIEQLQGELRANLVEVQATVAKNQAVLTAMDALYVDVKSLARQDKPAPAQLRELLQRVRISVNTPGLRRDAWDTAVADQALVHMPHDALRRLSEAYTAQNEAQRGIQTTMQVVGPIGRLTDALVDAEFGRADPVDVVKALYGYRLTLSAVLSIENDLAQQLSESLREPAPSRPASAASSH